MSLCHCVTVSLCHCVQKGARRNGLSKLRCEWQIYFLRHDNCDIPFVLSHWEQETLTVCGHLCMCRLLPGEPFEDMKFVAWQVVQKYVSVLGYCSHCNSVTSGVRVSMVALYPNIMV